MAGNPAVLKNFCGKEGLASVEIFMMGISSVYNFVFHLPDGIPLR
jgi:hypothetical protein